MTHATAPAFRFRALLGAACLALFLSALLPASADAHRRWMLPSATVLSGEDMWVTVDAAVSNELFYFEFVPLPMDELIIQTPDGNRIEPRNMAHGKYRNTFDFPLEQDGTYQVSAIMEGVIAFYREGDENRRWRGDAAEYKAMADELAEKDDLRVMETFGRAQFFVTLGAPTDDVLQPTSRGLEMVPDTHPNDLYEGEPATFRLLMDGQPAAGLDVEVVHGGSRYRDEGGIVQLKTDEEGRFTVTWLEPGMYLVEASARGGQADIEGATRSASYSATLEVLPQ